MGISHLSFRTPLIYRFVIAITLLVSVLAVCFPSWVNTYGTDFVVLLIVAIDVPHGAADCLNFKYSSPSGSVNQKAKFYLFYILLILAGILGWYLAPNVAISIFITISAYHLGQSNLYYLVLPQNSLSRVLIYGCWGAFIIFASILSNPTEVTEICNQFLGSTCIIALLNQKYLVVITIALNFLILSFLVQYHYISKQDCLKEVFNILILAVLFYTAPLIISFGIYFTLWHSLGSTLDQIKFIHQYDSTFGFSTFYLRVIPLTFISVLLLAIAEVLLHEFSFYQPSLTAATSLFFGSLAAITLPHALLRDELYQNHYSGLTPLTDS